MCQKDKKPRYKKGNLAVNKTAYKKRRGCLTSEVVELHLAAILYFKHYSFIANDILDIDFTCIPIDRW
jgi:hypothetical protein